MVWLVGWLVWLCGLCAPGLAQAIDPVIVSSYQHCAFSKHGFLNCKWVTSLITSPFRAVGEAKTWQLVPEDNQEDQLQDISMKLQLANTTYQLKMANEIFDWYIKDVEMTSNKVHMARKVLYSGSKITATRRRAYV